MKEKPRAIVRNYSGPRSVDFWQRVNRLKRRRNRESLYMAGILLQEQEDRILRWLENAERTESEVNE